MARVLTLSATAALLAAQPAPKVNLMLWPCDGSINQAYDMPTTFPDLVDHIVVSGSETAKPPLVWDIDGPSNASGTNIHIWSSYVPIETNQQWKYDGTIIKSIYNGKCVSAYAPVPGLPLALENCNASDPRQQFSINATSHAFVSGLNPGWCIDAGTQLPNCTLPPNNALPYCNTSLPPSERAADIAARLNEVDIAFLLESVNLGVPRLGVPRIRYNEALHGVVFDCGPSYYNASTGYNSTGCATSFPHAMLLGGTFNRTLWRTMAGIISDEGRAMHNTVGYGILTWAPDINPFRDPRWGRGQEVAGEDAFLIGEYVEQYARGMMEGEDTRYLKLLSTAKHFSFYDLETDYIAHVNRHNFTAVASLHDASLYYWLPFVSAVQRGHVQSVMCSYNSETVADTPVNNIPSCANSFFNNDVLRDQFGFTGFIVSDCNAIQNVYLTHNYTSTPLDAAIVSMNGGTDVECGPNIYSEWLPTAVANGNVTLARLQLAAERLMNVVFSLGLMDPPGSSVYDSYGAERVDTAEHRQLALDAAIQGITLLQNKPTSVHPWGAGNATLLPLRAAKLSQLAMIGPHANSSLALLSSYTGQNTIVNDYTPLASLTRALPGATITYAPGCADIPCDSNTQFPAAVAAAQAAQLAIVFVGLDKTQEAESRDRVNLTLPGNQEALIQAIAATGTPVIVVLIHGGPLAIEWTQANMPAIVSAHYPGELGGDAIAAILTGDASPSGRLTTTWYPADFVNQRAMTDMGLANGTGVTYLYYTGPSLWPFGYGLSYTTFQYVWLTSTPQWAAATSDAAVGALPPVAVNVTNTGSVTSDVSALAFVSSGIAGEPIAELFDFQRAASVAPGDTVTLYFTLPPQVLATVRADGARVMQPGAYTLWIGDVPRGGVTAAADEVHSRVSIPLQLAGDAIALDAGYHWD